MFTLKKDIPQLYQWDSNVKLIVEDDNNCEYAEDSIEDLFVILFQVFPRSFFHSVEDSRLLSSK